MASDTQAIPRETWGEYFDRLSTTLGTVKASVEVTGPDVGDQFISEEPMVLLGITYDRGDDILVIALDAPGGHREELEHIISQPQTIEAAGAEGLETELVLDVADAEGQQTIVTIKRAEALPAG